MQANVILRGVEVSMEKIKNAFNKRKVGSVRENSRIARACFEISKYCVRNCYLLL